MEKNNLNQILPNGVDFLPIKKSVRRVLRHFLQCRQKYYNQIEKNDGFFYQSLDDIKRATDLSEKTVIDVIKTLIDANVIEKKNCIRYGMYTTPNQYRFLCDGEEITNRLLKLIRPYQMVLIPTIQESVTSEAVAPNRPMPVETRSNDNKNNRDNFHILLSRIRQITDADELFDKSLKLFEWMNDEKRRYDFTHNDHKFAIGIINEKRFEINCHQHAIR